MLWNLTDVLSAEGKTEALEVSIKMEAFESRRGSFPLVKKTPLRLTAANDGPGRANVQGQAQVTQRMFCDRCLKEVDVEIPLSFGRRVYSPDVQESGSADDSDIGVMDGWQLDTEVLLYNELLMNQPEKVLCKPDCRGICRMCGKDLNEGECGCDTFVPDPRLAALQDIFHGNKEV